MRSFPFVRLAALALSGLLFLSACDSADDSDDLASLRLDVEPLVGSQAFTANSPFAIGGTVGRLDIAHLYLSGLTLLHEDGREILLMADPITVRAQDENQTELQHTIDERYVLVDLDAGRAPVALGEVPAGRYTGLRFLVGVDGLDNRIAPEDAPAGHPLAPQDPSMHWNWNAGYVFLRLDGLLDVDGDGQVDASTGTPRDPASGQWRMHLGLTPNATTVTLDEPFTLRGGEQDLHVQFDLARLVRDLDLGSASDRWCMTGGCADVAERVTRSLAPAFALHGVHAHGH
jgi:hypothetical protein